MSEVLVELAVGVAFSNLDVALVGERPKAFAPSHHDVASFFCTSIGQADALLHLLVDCVDLVLRKTKDSVVEI
jgi:hypothetical protein